MQIRLEAPRGGENHRPRRYRREVGTWPAHRREREILALLIQPSGTLPPASPRKGYESWIKSMFADLQPLA